MKHLLIYSVALKEIKSFLPRLNYKMQTNALRDLFNEVDTRKRNEIGFDDFATLYHKLIFDENVSIHLHVAKSKINKPRRKCT